MTHLKDESLVNIPLGDVRLEFWRFYEAQKKFVDQLQQKKGMHKKTM